MKTASTKLTGVPTEAKNASHFIRLICTNKNGTHICEGYNPSIKPKNPVSRFELFKTELGVYAMREFYVCGSLSSAITPTIALNWLPEEERTHLILELLSDGAVMF